LFSDVPSVIQQKLAARTCKVPIYMASLVVKLAPYQASAILTPTRAKVCCLNLYKFNVQKGIKNEVNDGTGIQDLLMPLLFAFL